MQEEWTLWQPCRQQPKDISSNPRANWPVFLVVWPTKPISGMIFQTATTLYSYDIRCELLWVGCILQGLTDPCSVLSNRKRSVPKYTRNVISYQSLQTSFLSIPHADSHKLFYDSVLHKRNKRTHVRSLFFTFPSCGSSAFLPNFSPHCQGRQPDGGLLSCQAAWVGAIPSNISRHATAGIDSR